MFIERKKFYIENLLSYGLFGYQVIKQIIPSFLSNQPVNYLYYDPVNIMWTLVLTTVIDKKLTNIKNFSPLVYVLEIWPVMSHNYVVIL